MKRWLVLSSVACLAIAGTAMGSVQTGNTELNFGAGLTVENAGKNGGLDYESWMVNGGLGYFVTDNVELGVVGLFKESTEKWNFADTETRMLKREANVYAFGGQAKYHFMPDNQLVPYVGAQLLWADVKVIENYNPPAAATSWRSDKQGILWGPIAGLRYELNEQNDLFVEYQYHIWTSNIHDIMEDGHSLQIGLIHRFK
jgi:hypothetical protein